MPLVDLHHRDFDGGGGRRGRVFAPIMLIRQGGDKGSGKPASNSTTLEILRQNGTPMAGSIDDFPNLVDLWAREGQFIHALNI